MKIIEEGMVLPDEVRGLLFLGCGCPCIDIVCPNAVCPPINPKCVVNPGCS